MDVDARLTTSEAAAYAGVTVAAVSNWRARDLLRPVARDHRGRPLYRLLDVAKAEARTRRPQTRRSFAV